MRPGGSRVTICVSRATARRPRSRSARSKISRCSVAPSCGTPLRNISSLLSSSRVRASRASARPIQLPTGPRAATGLPMRSAANSASVSWVAAHAVRRSTRTTVPDRPGLLERQGPCVGVVFTARIVVRPDADVALWAPADSTTSASTLSGPPDVTKSSKPDGGPSGKRPFTSGPMSAPSGRRKPTRSDCRRQASTLAISAWMTGSESARATGQRAHLGQERAVLGRGLLGSRTRRGCCAVGCDQRSG